MTIAPTYPSWFAKTRPILPLARRVEVLDPFVLFASRGLMVPRGLLVSRVYV